MRRAMVDAEELESSRPVDVPESQPAKPLSPLGSLYLLPQHRLSREADPENDIMSPRLPIVHREIATAEE
jgi:hypothetical protein